MHDEPYATGMRDKGEHNKRAVCLCQSSLPGYLYLLETIIVGN
jgi:hypothetical protein